MKKDSPHARASMGRIATDVQLWVPLVVLALGVIMLLWVS